MSRLIKCKENLYGILFQINIFENSYDYKYF